MTWTTSTTQIAGDVLPKTRKVYCGTGSRTTGRTSQSDVIVRLDRMEAANADLLRKLAEVTAQRDQLEDQMMIDPLTGVQNRRGLETAFEKHGEGAVFAILDLDHFKAINDTLGHEIGDRVLEQFAVLLTRHVGADTPVYRIGGEEFVVLFPRAKLVDVAQVMDAFRASLENKTLTRTGDPVEVSFSAGLALRHATEQDFVDVYKQADARLYIAKAGGRARTCYSEKPASFSSAA